MKVFKFNESNWWESNPWKMDADEVTDYLIEFIEDYKQLDILGEFTQEHLEKMYKYTGFVYPIYVESKPVDRFSNPDIDFDESKDGVTYLMAKIYHPKYRIKGNLDSEGYTRSMVRHFFKKFVRMSKVPVNILIKLLEMNYDRDPLSVSIVRIEFLNEQKTEENFNI